MFANNELKMHTLHVLVHSSIRVILFYYKNTEIKTL